MNTPHVIGRSVASSLLLFLTACATAPVTDMAPLRVAVATDDAAAAPRTDDAMAPAVAPVTPKRVLGGDSYTIGKVGMFMPAGDLDNLDDGLAAEVIFGHKLMPFLSIEGSLGYLSAEAQGGSNQFDLTAIPLFVNGRLSLPILILEAYGGVGVGGIYADYEAGAFSDSDFVLAYQAFIGLEVGLGNLAVGAEYKYLQSEDTSDNFSIEGGIASLFVSVPF